MTPAQLPDSIPIRLTPLPGEDLASWLHAYAHTLHTTITELLRMTAIPALDSATGGNHGRRPWTFGLTDTESAALTALTGTTSDQLAKMTLSYYNGTGLAMVDTRARTLARPRWWRQTKRVRFCPLCLIQTGGRWALSGRLPWSFACTRHHVLLADTCPTCGLGPGHHQPDRHQLQLVCDRHALPTPALTRRGAPRCPQPLTGVPARRLNPGGAISTAAQHLEDTITAILAIHSDPPGDQEPHLAAHHSVLDNLHDNARAALSALRANPHTLPAPLQAIRDELGDDLTRCLDHDQAHDHGIVRQQAPMIAFGTAVAHLINHGDGDTITWITDTVTGRGRQSPGILIARWPAASPQLHTALLKQRASTLTMIHQLRYSTATPTPAPPSSGNGTSRAASVPALFWRSWALRLNPGGFSPLPYRHALSVLLLMAATNDNTFRGAARLLGHAQPGTNKYGPLSDTLRNAGVLDVVLNVIGQLAQQLDQQPAPIDYARRRSRRRFTTARLDLADWQRQCHKIRRPSAPRHETFARLHLIEILTGNHPYFFPEPLRLPTADGPEYAEFLALLPTELTDHLHRQARRLLTKAKIREPVEWEPPFDWVHDRTWPGPHPDDITAQQLQPLFTTATTTTALATRLGITTEHLRVAASHHPAPATRRRTRHPVPPAQPSEPDLDQLLHHLHRGLTTTGIAQATGHTRQQITQTLTRAGIPLPPDPRDVLRDLDPTWLRDQYENRHRHLNEIAAELGIPAHSLSAHARKLGIALRHGIASHKHPLADHGGPGAFPPEIWQALTDRRAITRAQRLLKIQGHRDLREAAQRFGTHHSALASQIARLEKAAGTTLVMTNHAGVLQWTRNGKPFIYHLRRALETIGCYTP